jgi:bifunctional DNA-binding transcriptional regulator/antitoxin component of YhaV-PrlF toxin-antitoxin module
MSVASEIARLGSRGHFALPPRLRKVLGVKPGDYVALTPTEDGVLIKPAGPPAHADAEATLIELVRQIGEQLEAQGVTEEEQLDGMIDSVKQEVHRRRYGGRTS